MPQLPPPASSRHPASAKRRMYIVGTAMGVALCALYGYSVIQEGSIPAFALNIGLMIELLAFLLLFALAPRWMETLEIAFYFVMVVSLMILGGGQILALYARQALNPDKLGFLVNSLALWLTIYQLGAFLALPTRHMSKLMTVIWATMGLLTGAAALIMRPPEEWRYSYLISWVAGLMALGIVSLLISWLGRRQQQQATTDALTGIANRHLLAELLERHHERATTQQRGYALMLIDIDRFKTINDTLGHAIGDRVLADVAALIVRNLRRTDHVGRWGGDEFLVLLVDADLRRAQEIAERIRTATERRVPADGARPTLSIGVHCYRAGQSIEQVLACADEALYQAKYAGRNQVGLWVPR